MPIMTTNKWYSPELCRANPNLIFVYGDNTLRRGSGGQACVRGEPNTVGIATKLAPDDDEGSFFVDGSESDMLALRLDLMMFRSRLSYRPKDVYVIPVAGLGTGLSDMPNRCPKLYQYLVASLELFKCVYGEVPDTLVN